MPIKTLKAEEVSTDLEDKVFGDPKHVKENRAVIDRVIAQKPATRRAPVKTVEVGTVYAKDGKSGLVTTQTVVEGSPTLRWSTDHVDDIEWVYEEVSRTTTAGPVGDFTASQADWVAGKAAAKNPKTTAKKTTKKA